MLRECIADAETNGLLDQVTRVHVLAVKDLQSGAVHRFREHQMREALALLDEFDIIIGHNFIKFDSPVLAKLFAYSIHWSKLRDTMVLARLIWPEIATTDVARIQKGAAFPKNLIGQHSLKAWGHRLGNFKGEYTGPWDEWSQEMEDYCVQDLSVTESLWNLIKSKNWAEQSILLETQVAYILARQERFGFLFDEKAAAKLYTTLIAKREELTGKLREVFGPMFLPDGKEFTPKRDDAKRGYVAGAPFTKVKLTMFNPASRAHIGRWLRLKRGWVPREFTENGAPKVDETVIGALKYPEAKPLAEYLLVEKRIGQLAEGNEAWMKKVGPDGRIHGGVNTNGAVTGRMTHAGPNMSQVPASYSPYGEECRALFVAPEGRCLVGADADALELRDLAGYMARYDNGDYIKVVLEGDKSKGTDIHSVNARALGLDPKEKYHAGTGRDMAKTWFYAFIYGAGDAKLGTILTGKRNAKARGAASRAAFMKNLPALGKLVAAVKAKVKASKTLIGLDGRILQVRSDHSALNTLLQSAGAVQMKKALCILDDTLQQSGLVPGNDYEFVANVHDEWQIECKEEHRDRIGNAATEAIRLAGEHFQFRCPLAGQWKSGRTWAETH